MQRFAGLGDQHLFTEYEPIVREAMIRKVMEAHSWLVVIMITDLIGSDDGRSGRGKSAKRLAG